MMQRKVEIINAHDDPEDFERALRELSSRQSADAYREANAKHVRESLERAAAKRGMPVAQFALSLAEDHAYRIFWDWLCVYNRLTRERGKPEPDIALIVEHAEELGKIHERLRWRSGVDPETRERREVLALRAKNSRLALDGDRDGGRASANAMRREEAEEWRAVAREVAATSPFGGARLEARILAELTRRGLPARSGPAIRKAIAGIRR
jgi:hypothetical protein